jgi:hypothetical protein
VTCIFCGLQRPASGEDVVSKWIRRTLNPATEVIIRAEPTGAVSRLQHLTVTLENMVCQTCNNTWMSRLENRGVKPFLEPMLTNKHAVTLDETQQRDLARWATIKVLLMEYAMRQRRAHLRSIVGYAPSDPELAWLFGNDDPPPRSRVWLGAFDAQGRILVSTQSRLLTSAPTPGDAAPVAAHMTTLTVGHVLLQVFTHQLRPGRRTVDSGLRRQPPAALRPGAEPDLANRALRAAVAAKHLCLPRSAGQARELGPATDTALLTIADCQRIGRAPRSASGRARAAAQPSHNRSEMRSGHR